MLVSASVCALFFTILVWCNSHTWIYFKHKGKYVKVEDQVNNNDGGEVVTLESFQDPYMPLSTIDRGGRGGSMGAPVYQRYQLIFAVIVNHPDLVLVAGQETSTPLRRHHPTTGP